MYRTEMITGDLSSGFLPCTPNGCIKLIEKSGVKVNYFGVKVNYFDIILEQKSKRRISGSEALSFPVLGINVIATEGGIEHLNGYIGFGNGEHYNDMLPIGGWFYCCCGGQKQDCWNSGFR